MILQKLPSAAAVLQLHRGVIMPLATLLHALILMAVIDPLHGIFKLLLHGEALMHNIIILSHTIATARDP